MPYNPNPPAYSDPRFREYQDKLSALGPINTDEKAKQYQRLFEKFHNTNLTVHDHETPVLPTP